MDIVQEPQPAKQPSAWAQRDRLGFLGALTETIRSVLFSPSKFFGNLQLSPSYGDPFFFYFSLTVVATVLSYAIGMLLTPLPELPLPVPVFVSLMFIFVLITSAVGIFIGAGITHLFVMMFGGKGGYRGTFEVMAYSAAAGLFGIIPFIGGVIAGIWSIVICVIGFKHVHNMSTARAVLAYFLLPFIIMMIVAFIAMLAAIAIPNLLRAKISANDALARSTLRSLSTASETYATANGGLYPAQIADLTDAVPPYINTNYCGQEITGFRFDCAMSSEGYMFTATPVEPGTSGTTVYTITTGGILTPTSSYESYGDPYGGSGSSEPSYGIDPSVPMDDNAPLQQGAVGAEATY